MVVHMGYRGVRVQRQDVLKTDKRFSAHHCAQKKITINDRSFSFNTYLRNRSSQLEDIPLAWLITCFLANIES